jgi:hypothetical protein
MVNVPVKRAKHFEDILPSAEIATLESKSHRGLIFVDLVCSEKGAIEAI